MRSARRSWPLALIVATTWACGDRGSPDPCAGKTGSLGARDVAISSRGLERRFHLSVPDSAVRGAPVPLILVCHGANGTGAVEIAVSGFDAKAASEGFIVAGGDGIGGSWNAGVSRNPDNPADGVDDVGFTRDMIAAIEAEYCIDAASVYATGFSKGAEMVFRLACEASDLFAALAPVAGSLGLASCAPATPRPIQIVNNVSDPAVPFALGELSFRRFLEIDACDEARESVQLAATATCEVAPRCAGGATTELCAVQNVLHHWPGGATDRTARSAPRTRSGTSLRPRRSPSPPAIASRVGG